MLCNFQLTNDGKLSLTSVHCACKNLFSHRMSCSIHNNSQSVIITMYSLSFSLSPFFYAHTHKKNFFADLFQCKNPYSQRKFPSKIVHWIDLAVLPWISRVELMDQRTSMAEHSVGKHIKIWKILWKLVALLKMKLVDVRPQRKRRKMAYKRIDVIHFDHFNMYSSALAYVLSLSFSVSLSLCVRF